MATTGKADGRAQEQELEAFVREYIRLWNDRDADAIWTRVYRLGPDAAMHSAAELKTAIAQLQLEGFDHTDLHSVEARLLGPTKAEAQIRFTRVKTDGTAMPPGERGARYDLERFADGWRITRLAAA